MTVWNTTLHGSPREDDHGDDVHAIEVGPSGPGGGAPAQPILNRSSAVLPTIFWAVATSVASNTAWIALEE